MTIGRKSLPGAQTRCDRRKPAGHVVDAHVGVEQMGHASKSGPGSTSGGLDG